MNTTAGKGPRIQAMFDDIAGRYDLMNRVMTGGQDQRWRRFLATKADLGPGDRVLDLASGTGDIAFTLKAMQPEADVVAGDFSLGMMRHGQNRKQGDQVHWIACDAMNLPFQDATFDAVTFGYLLRNVESIDKALSEVHRILKPGGRLVCLDTTPPKPGLLRPFIAFYLKHGLPLLGRIFAGGGGAYAYLSDSTMAFQTPADLGALMEKASFQEVSWQTFMFHTIAVHWAKKAL